jgi:hypothetical protein
VSRVDKAKVDGAIGSRSERDVEELSLAGVESGLWTVDCGILGLDRRKCLRVVTGSGPGSGSGKRGEARLVVESRRERGTGK